MRCFHCGEQVPEGTNFTLVVERERRSVCCPGCLAVAALIAEQGLARFYDYRSAPNRKPKERASEGSPWDVCDRPDVARQLAREIDAAQSELRCRVEGMTCAACAWLIDRGLRAIDGIDEVGVDPVSGEASIRFNPAKVRLSRILDALASFGFEPRPAVLGGSAAADAQAARAELKRLAVAGLGSAQVMTLAAALYLGAFKSMEASFTSFLVLVSMLIATPVVLYSGAPIFRAAWRDLKRWRVGMDVPVGLAIAIALGASLVNAFRQRRVLRFRDDVRVFSQRGALPRIARAAQGGRRVRCAGELAADQRAPATRCGPRARRHDRARRRGPCFSRARRSRARRRRARLVAR
jgi:Cu2+-exporting ATPase